MGAKQTTLGQYDLSGKVVILTGATDGIGKVMARTLSSYKPKRLILPIRNREKGQLLLDYIQSSNDGKVECIELWDLDLTKLNSVKSFCDKFISEVDELHYLFNNAGIVKPNAPPTMTVDGYEEQFQCNFLSQFYLTNYLVPTMIKSASSTSPAKIIFTSSNFHKYGVIDFENLDGKKSHAFTELYNNSKLMINLYSNELNRRLKESNVTSTAIHPGFIATNIVNQDQLSNFGKILRNMELLCFAKSPEVGCVNMIYPVFSTDIEDGGKYFEDCKEVAPIQAALDQELAKKVWDHCDELLKKVK